ncbi:MAG: hypothetical protein ACRD6N_16330, partial [Pyrinomonadaceae bacterium]
LLTTFWFRGKVERASSIANRPPKQADLFDTKDLVFLRVFVSWWYLLRIPDDLDHSFQSMLSTRSEGSCPVIPTR